MLNKRECLHSLSVLYLFDAVFNNSDDNRIFPLHFRNCIGQNFAMHEIKVTVCRLLHRFELAVVPDRPAIPKPELVMRAEGGMYITLTPRH